MNKRVQFRERQRLSAADLLAEQGYAREAEQAHQLRPHRPGVLFGLELEEVIGRVIPSLLLRRGAATDPNGRLLVIAEDRDVAAVVRELAAGDGRFIIWIGASEQIRSTRQRGRRECGPGSHDRLIERTVVSATLEDGSLPGAVPLGVVEAQGLSMKVEPRFRPPYASLSAASILAPSRSWRMQVGTIDRRDPHHFAIAELRQTAQAQEWTARLAILKDGSTNIAGPLEIRGVRATAQLPAQAGKALQVAARSAGQVAGIQTTLEPYAGNRFRLRLTTHDPQLDEEHIASLDRLSEVVNRDSLLVTALLQQTPFAGAGRKKRRKNVAKSLELPFPGVSLDAPLVAKAVARDPCADTPAAPRPTCVAPSSLVFPRPSVPAPPRTPWRLAFTQLPPPEGAKEGFKQVQLGLGDPGDKGDRTARFEIGHHDGSIATFLPLLTVTADRTTIIHGKRGAGAVEDAALRVTGHIRQQPLPNDPANNLFKELLVLASVSGFRSAAAHDSNLALAFVNMPAVVPVNHPWQYQLDIGYPVSARALWLVETLAPDSYTMPSALFLNNQAIGRPPFRQVVGHVTGWDKTGRTPIHVVVLAKRGAVSIYAEADADIEFEIAPELDLKALPEVAAPDVPWSAQISVRNPAPRSIRVTRFEAARTKPGEEPINWTEIYGGALDVAPGASAALGSVGDVGSDADLQMNMRITYSYATDPLSRPWTRTAAQVVLVLEQVDIAARNMPASISLGAAWRFDVDLHNVTSLPITDVTVRQRLLDQDGNEIEARAVASGISLAKDETKSFNVANTEPTAAGVTRADVWLSIELTHDGRVWTYEKQVGSVTVITIN
jgi:hypothetical protein